MGQIQIKLVAGAMERLKPKGGQINSKKLRLLKTTLKLLQRTTQPDELFLYTVQDLS